MKEGKFAKEQLMEDYLTSLLTDQPEEDVVQREAVSKLLESAKLEDAPIMLSEPSSEPLESIDEVKELVDEVETKDTANDKVVSQTSSIPKQGFQALFFEVAGLTLALPLTELGGIHKLEKIGPLFGKPDWFKGVMLHRDEKLTVVDTARWVMPEKYNEKLAESIKYQYLIMLDDSHWGLACERLITTSVLQPSDVKWREGNSKRPWLAGMVKEKMCALVNVKQLIVLLNKGLSSK